LNNILFILLNDVLFFININNMSNSAFLLIFLWKW